MRQQIDSELDERSSRILQAIIGYYILTGDPVGSRKICKQYNLNLSPATTRNIMADLEEMGYLYHPHTSAGRVPTDMGYRFYVNHLTKWRKLSSKEADAIDARRFTPVNSLESLLEEISIRLSTLSKCVGLVMGPDISQAVFKKIEFIHLRPCRIQAVLISHWGYVHQKILKTDRPYTQEQLDQMSRCINDHLNGLSLIKVRRKLRNILQKQKDHYQRLLVRAARLSQEVLDDHKDRRIFIRGQRNILTCPDFTDNKKLRALLGALEEKEKLLDLLDKCMQDGDVHIFIGSEMEDRHLEDLSLITSSFTYGDESAGMLGVIGPTRLEYSCVIPMVTFAAQMISRRLEEV
jgi:heat-inducible transcriptional repressor